MNLNLGKLCEGVKSQDLRSLAQLLTAVESIGPKVLEYPDLLQPPRVSFRMGLTGPPGSGKSSLINELIKLFRQKSWSVGVLAVDPSSPLSRGAILGDRIRYSEHFSDKNVFIRSLGARGSLGGLSSSTYLMLRAYDLFGFDIVLIETVGVGQSELEVVNVADTVGLVLVPESGDSIQIMKAGILEIADFYIVNKADRPGAKAFSNELKIQGGQSKVSCEVFETVATRGEGVVNIVNFLERSSPRDLMQKRSAPDRLRTEAQALLRAQYEKTLQKEIQCIEGLEDFKKLLIS